MFAQKEEILMGQTSTIRQFAGQFSTTTSKRGERGLVSNLQVGKIPSGYDAFVSNF